MRGFNKTPRQAYAINLQSPELLGWNVSLSPILIPPNLFLSRFNHSIIFSQNNWEYITQWLWCRHTFDPVQNYNCTLEVDDSSWSAVFIPLAICLSCIWCQISVHLRFYEVLATVVCGIVSSDTVDSSAPLHSVVPSQSSYCVISAHVMFVIEKCNLFRE